MMPLSRRDRQKSLLGVIAAMAVVNLVYGISFPLFALVLDAQGISKTLIGLNTMVQALAVLVLAPLAPWMMRRFQPARIMQVTAVVLAALFIVAGLVQEIGFWFLLRFIIGATTAMLWTASEAMINSLAEESWRGRVVAIYSAVGAAGFAFAPILLILTGSSGMLPFIATSAITLLAAVPLFWTVSETLSGQRGGKFGLVRVLWLAPAVMFANIVYAAAIESISTFFPIFGAHLGLSGRVALGMMTLIGVGGMVLSLPLGWLADHVNRMSMLSACVILTMAGLVAMPYLVTLPVLSVIFVFVFGGVSGMIYTLGVVLIGEQFRGAMLATATTTFTACWGAGSVIGPMIVGAGMDWIGVQNMGLIIFLIFLPYLPLPLMARFRTSGNQ